MAVRKKKTTDQIINNVSKLIAEATMQSTDVLKKKTRKSKDVRRDGAAETIVSSEVWPKIEQGSHLTVRTYKDGRIELEWDDAALLKDVRSAIASVELTQMKPVVRAKAASRAKKLKSA